MTMDAPFLLLSAATLLAAAAFAWLGWLVLTAEE
jgi:hypothetical protein